MLSLVSFTEHRHQPVGGEPADAVVVIGMSAGGVRAMRELICELPAPFPATVIVAQHAGSAELPDLIRCWSGHAAVHAASGQCLQSGIVYVCPAHSHIVVNADATLTVSSKPRVRFVRPSIDWLLDSVAAVYEERAVAVLLSGANDDGARGARRVREVGGTVIVQDPSTCTFPEMPLSAIKEGVTHAFLPPAQIPNLLMRCVTHKARPSACNDYYAGDANAPSLV